MAQCSIATIKGMVYYFKIRFYIFYILINIKDVICIHT